MHKNERIQALKKKVLKRAQKLGWRVTTIDELPKKTRLALSDTGFRLPKRADRKRFGKSSGKSRYGHFSGYNHKHLDARSLRERAHDME